MMEERVNISVERNDVECAQEILADIGLDVNTAVKIYLREIIRSGGIPFHLHSDVPNAETMAAIREVEEGKTHGPFHSVEELMESLNADD